MSSSCEHGRINMGVDHLELDLFKVIFVHDADLIEHKKTADHLHILHYTIRKFNPV